MRGPDRRPLLRPIRLALRPPVKKVVVGSRRALFGASGGRLPDWLIVGAMKAGTTSLHHALHQSRHAVSPATKEVHFFDFNWARGDHWYRSHFLRVPGTRTGEASPSYLFHPRAAERAASLVPDIKLIVLLRDPVDRAYSHWAHQVRAGRERLEFVEAIDAEPERLRASDPDDPESTHRHFSYVARGMYADQLERWYDVFARDQVLVLRAEDVFDDFPRAVARVCTWLDLATPATRRLVRRNTGMARPSLDLAVRRRLVQRYQAANGRLPRLVGDDIGW